VALKIASGPNVGSTVQPPWAHQKATKTFFAKVDRGYDFSDPGTGKTRSHAEIFRDRKGRKRMLVVCPKTLMFAAWGADIERFTPELTVSYATAEQREAAFAMNTDVVIINTDGVKWFTDKNKKEQRRRRKYLEGFDELVIDESTTFKHHTSQRSKAMKEIRVYFKRRRALTGTPTANSVMELWHQALIIDDGASLGDSYFRMRDAMQVSTQVGPDPKMVRYDDKPQAESVVSSLINPRAIRHAFEDVMKHVPANHRSVREFTLSPKALAAYKRMESDYILLSDDPTHPITAVHAAALRTKLLQIASGAVYGGSGEDGAYQIIDHQRYELVTELVDSVKHSVVFFNWKHQRDELCKAFDAAGFAYALIDGSVNQRERDQIVVDYQAGKYKTLLLHPRTGAHGLTLTRGTTTIICSPIYEADILKQAIFRIYRGAQDQVTNTILVQAKGTVEDLVYARLDAKTTRMEDFLSQCKSRRPK